MPDDLLTIAERYSRRLNTGFFSTKGEEEAVFLDLIWAWEHVDDPGEFRNLLDATFWCDLPMWLISRTFTYLLRNEGRVPELLENYCAFLAMYCGLAQDVPYLLHQEADALRHCRKDEAEAIFRSLPDYRWGDLVIIKDEAPEAFGPGRVALVYAEIFVVKDAREAASYGVDVGEWIYEVLHHPFDLFRLDGRFVFVPARWLKPGPAWEDVLNA
ncbi:hypothetical protein EA187_06200 [Lujinxingia sediminis]|uniref:DUF2313 domain-containing protein n=1 Tax=Lujinxingia sediminis TaxID=2480984 RepID=A0ABY0CUI0_9DELT|nr:hypothetical protein [Lujinxingia sediminis]RVU46725.1 hypothetical protein EA187_06200 [Lujinxingia sediminis]